ncbi:GNAT family N-acetyltransferase [Brevibacillus humidisoli]|uniref:GNAT family N-acetyltransferase n=1 Tax=Brevibacillus humidisoli TaxID=2895522 RepID=UPI001E47D7E7|nr:GNAT family protein [Brevibacillus humidisoli]UFJ43054.1 GNAT family N-acetyltransferase [Brevibacillus humidisoli]
MDLFDLRMIGRHVCLRLLTAEDAPAFLDYLLRNKHYHDPYMPHRPSDSFTLENVRRLTDQRQRVGSDQEYAFAVIDNESERLVGKVKLSGIIRGSFHSANLSYDIDEAFSSRGYVTEAVKMLISFAYSGLALHRIQAAIMPRNLPSQRVVEKAGFVREGYSQHYIQINGIWEDHITYAITKERYDRLPAYQKEQGLIAWITET